MSRKEYNFFLDNKKNIQSVQLLSEVLDVVRRGYFHYEKRITLSELQEIASENTNKHYRTFHITKKRGGLRTISAPDNHLKEIQNCIRILLTEVSYPENTSIVDNAECHVGKDVVYNMDIKDFYPSINAAQITASLISLKYFKCSYEVALLLSSLVTMRSENGLPILPQGAPSSPIVADIVVRRLDARISKYAKLNNFSYSRYADDITFSCAKKQPWRKHAKMIMNTISSEGFIINKKKTRVSFYYQRQEVTGVTVNSKVNLSKTYIKQLRTIIHNWEKDGYMMASNKFITHYSNNRLNSEWNQPKMENVVEGKLSYLKMIRCHTRHGESKVNDPLWEKLYKRYVTLVRRDLNLFYQYQSRICKFKDNYRGPLVLEVRENDDQPWKIIKVQDEYNVWHNGTEKDAYRVMNIKNGQYSFPSDGFISDGPW